MVKLRKLMFVLPNLFTVSSIFCGFYALTLCAGEASPSHLYQAALAIFIAMFFDGFDGRVARLTKTQSQFGVELDSLADVISFGVAPAMLVYKWGLAPMGLGGVFIAFVFVACAALRLARFNVIAHRSPDGGASAWFVGLPTPLAAGTIVSIVIAHHGLTGAAPVSAAAQVPIAVTVLALSALMVSSVRYRTFKDVRVSRTSAAVFLAMCGLGVLVAVKLHGAFVLVAYFSVYLLMGLAESAFLLGRRLTGATVPAGSALAAEQGGDEDEDDSPSDEQYL
jgi:CDP-diacylglycerol---serine O-phosphatidyltransferase